MTRHGPPMDDGAHRDLVRDEEEARRRADPCRVQVAFDRDDAQTERASDEIIAARREREAVREYVFTFGVGDPENAGRFVRIRGTYDGARQQMFARFGKSWGFQYRSEDAAGVEKYNLREIK